MDRPETVSLPIWTAFAHGSGFRALDSAGRRGAGDADGRDVVRRSVSACRVARRLAHDSSGPTVGRVVGLAVLCLAIGALPRGAERDQTPHALLGLWLLSALVAVYLIYLGVSAGPVGILFWPAAATHLMLAVLLAGVALRGE